MSKIAEDETEADLKINLNAGAPEARIPPTRFPGLAEILGKWIGAIPVVGAAGRFLVRHDFKADYESDPEHHQIIIYIAEPGYHTSKVLKELQELKKRQKT